MHSSTVATIAKMIEQYLQRTLSIHSRDQVCAGYLNLLGFPRHRSKERWHQTDMLSIVLIRNAVIPDCWGLNFGHGCCYPTNLRSFHLHNSGHDASTSPSYSSNVVVSCNLKLSDQKREMKRNETRSTESKEKQRKRCGSNELVMPRSPMS